MMFWDDIVNRSLLGSGKAQLHDADLPVVIGQTYETASTGDPEEDFLRLTALAFQFRQAGSRPLNLKITDHQEAESELKSYCEAKAIHVLQSILEEELYRFLGLWLSLCVERDKIATPVVIPALLDVAARRKVLRKLILQVSGKRGEWLSSLNPQWNFLASPGDSTSRWENGTPDERKELLSQLREQKSPEALALLQSTWVSEGTNEKISFLGILKINPSANDLSWLETLKEKGQKVNGLIQELLKLIPGSSIVLGYSRILQEVVNVRKGKALLGMINKTVLEVNETYTFPDSLFKSGIEKLSSDKNVSDSRYIIVQLITAVPPTFWNNHLQLSPQSIIELFLKEKQTAFYLPALAIAASRFNEREWVTQLLDHGANGLDAASIVSLLGTLNGKEQDAYALKLFDESPREIIQLLTEHEEEWSADLTKKILTFTSTDVYQYNRNFYKSTSALMPVSTLNMLESLTPTEEQKKVYWKNQADELSRLLTLKQQTLQSFNA